MYQPSADVGDYVRNQILRNLRPPDLETLLPHTEKVAFDLHVLLHRQGESIDHVYFIESGTVSMIALLEDGSEAEVGLVGREGLVGLPMVLGSRIATLDALVQVQGVARRMRAAQLQQVFSAMPALRDALLAYVNAFHFQVARTAACNGRHSLEQRLARWILMTADRVENDQFTMTQDFIARMLAVQRPGVNVAVQRLQRAGLLHHQRSWLKVTDRPGLEAVACDCYAAVRGRFPPPRR